MQFEYKSDNYENNYHQNEIDSLKNKIGLLNKDLYSLDNQNKELTKKYLYLEEENKNYIIQIEQLNIENEDLKEQVKYLNNNNIQEENESIKDLVNSIQTKEKELAEKNKEISELKLKLQNLESINKGKIIELKEKLELKEKEVKEVKEIISRYPFKLNRGEHLMSVVFSSHDKTIIHSFLCKNTEQFKKLEKLLYKEYPQYFEDKSKNYFMVHGVRINEDKTLKENGIHNSDIIIFGIALNPVQISKISEIRVAITGQKKKFSIENNISFNLKYIN